jgi:hypothetical protein
MSEQFETTVIVDLSGNGIVCPACQGIMEITFTRPAQKGRTLKMFECTGCAFARVLSVHADAPETGEVKWVLDAVRKPR